MEWHYSNDVRIRLSAHDVSLKFLHMTDADQATDESPLVSLARVGVVMSPQQTKAFAQALGRVVEQYEKTFGPIGPGAPPQGTD